MHTPNVCSSPPQTLNTATQTLRLPQVFVRSSDGGLHAVAVAKVCRHTLQGHKVALWLVPSRYLVCRTSLVICFKVIRLPCGFSSRYLVCMTSLVIMLQGHKVAMCLVPSRYLICMTWLVIMLQSHKVALWLSFERSRLTRASKPYIIIIWLPCGFSLRYISYEQGFKTIHNNYMVAMWLTFPFLTSRLTKASKPYIIVWLQCGLSLRDISSDQAFKTVLYGSNVARRVETSRLTRIAMCFKAISLHNKDRSRLG